MLALGVCGTDREIVSGEYGWPPPGERRLVLGHESLGRVAEAPAGSELKPGDLVAGIVRRALLRHGFGGHPVHQVDEQLVRS